MALIECYECRASISSDARTCPQCGARRRRGILESLFLISLGLVLLFFAFMYWSLPSKEERQQLREMASRTDPLAPTIAQAPIATPNPSGQRLVAKVSPYLAMTPDRKFVVTGNTNLPNQYVLLIHVYHVGGNLYAGTRYTAQANATVENGQFNTGPMATLDANDHLLPGPYELEFSSLAPELQPSSTWATIGTKGENLGGPLIGTFNCINFHLQFRIDDALQVHSVQ